MTTNGANSCIQSEIRRVNHDRRTSTPSPASSRRHGNFQQSPQLAVHMKEPPLYSPHRPDEVAVNSTPIEAPISYLLRTVERQT